MYNLSNKEIKDIVDQEGLSSCIENIIKYESIKNNTLKMKWKEVQYLLKEIKEIINNG